MKKRRLKSPTVILKAVKIGAVGAGIILAIFFFLNQSAQVLKKARFFAIRNIATNVPGADLAFLKGENIFSLNLKKISSYLLENYPTYRKIHLIRILPNRLLVYFEERHPVAVIKLYRSFYVDQEAVLFDVPAGLIPQDLPIIIGLETKIFGPKSGRGYEKIKELSLALEIIAEIKKNRALANYALKKIDLSSVANTSFIFAPDLEVRIGMDDPEAKIAILSSLLLSLRNELEKIKYLDLRFKEPVIKYKDVK